jgi:hypothetical protein
MLNSHKMDALCWKWFHKKKTSGGSQSDSYFDIKIEVFNYRNGKGVADY